MKQCKRQVQVTMHQALYDDLKDLAKFEQKSLSEILRLGWVHWTYLAVVADTSDHELRPAKPPFDVIRGGRP
jgi:hypothetical protein